MQPLKSNVIPSYGYKSILKRVLELILVTDFLK